MKVMVNGTEYSMDLVVSYMDDEIREELHEEIAPCGEQEFVNAYIEKHFEKYGEDFTIN